MNNTSTIENFDPVQQFNKAESLIAQNQDTQALSIYLDLLDNQSIAPLASFRLGEIENRLGNANKAYMYHRKAFELDNRLLLRITSNEHPHHNYEYKEVKEIELSACTLCGAGGISHSSYNLTTNIDFIEGFSPIREWKLCEACNHIFASRYPKNLSEILSSTSPTYHINPNLAFFSLLSRILSDIGNFAKGNKLLEVGVGAGEMSAVAKEMMFDVTGLDIRPVYAKNISERLNIPVHAVDFLEYQTSERYDVIILGDVLEHVLFPLKMLEKAKNLLNPYGVLWVSTPNFESAYSNIIKDKDPMWRVCEHINYFSFKSLQKALMNNGFEPVDYKISSHYNGSMEVISIKK